MGNLLYTKNTNRLLKAGNKAIYAGAGSQIPWNGLQNYWRMEDATDAMGARNLTGNTVTYSAGKHNNCGVVGNGGYWKAAEAADTYFRNQTFSMGGWVYKKISVSYNIMWSHDMTSHSSPYYANHLRFYTTSLTYYLNRNGSAVGGDVAGNPDDLWYHIFVTVTPTKFVLYRNGINVLQNTANTGNITYYNQEARIGNSPNFATNGLGMKIDEWGYWLRELSATEVGILYDYGQGIYY